MKKSALMLLVILLPFMAKAQNTHTGAMRSPVK